MTRRTRLETNEEVATKNRIKTYNAKPFEIKMIKRKIYIYIYI